MEFEELKLLGLTSYEIQAYLTLLEKGENKASFITKNTKIPSSKIYETLSSLEHKGLIYTIPKDVKEFGANPVEVIKKLLEEYKDKINTINKKIKELETIPTNQKEGNIIVVEGKKGFEKLIKNLPEINTPFTYNIIWKADTNLNYLRNFKKNSKNKILKILADKKTPKKNLEIIKKYKKDIKQIDATGIAMEITNQTVLISILETNKTIFIKSKNFAKVMQQFFESYYDNN